MSLDSNDYCLKEINELCELNSSSYSKKDNWEFINYLDTKNIIKGEINEIKYLDPEMDKVPSRAKRKVNINDIIISTVRPNQEHYGIIKKEYDNFLVSTGFTTLTVDTSHAVPEFIYYYITQPYITQSLQTIAEQSTTSYPSVKPSDIGNLIVELPSLDIQNKIANILTSIENKINVNKEINKNLEELAKAIYRHHFIDFKPYALGGLMKHSSQGMIPKDWSVQSIEEFVDDMKNGGTPKRGESDYWDNGTVPWLKTGEINNNIIIKSEEHITELGLKNSSAKLLPINSIIMALYGKGTAARIGLLKFEATTNQACCAMICNDFNKTLFLYLFLLFNQKEIENLASGSVQQNLSKDLIANLELVVPPIEIIDNLPFKEIFDTIANNYFEIEYLINLRDTLLPKLMSGEIDVSKINCDLKIIIRKIYIKSSKLFLWRYLSENKNYIKNTKSNETLLKSRTIYKINKFLAKFTTRYRYYRQ